MYLPKVHEETRVEVLHRLIDAHPLGTWVMLGEGELVANPVPFFIDSSRGEFGTLMAHVSRANPVWKLPGSDVLSLVCFQGAQTYITPSWYPSKLDHGKAVPTWNYVTVQAQGVPRFIEDPKWLLAHVELLTQQHESKQEVQWKVKDAPDDYIERLLGAIVGVEIPIQKLTGKWKVSQNRSEVDKKGIINGLENNGDEQSLAMASWVRGTLEQ
jgi:transcriptional regulator